MAKEIPVTPVADLGLRREKEEDRRKLAG